MHPEVETLGAGLSTDNSVELGGYRYPTLTVYADTSEDNVYNFVKAIDLSYEYADHERFIDRGIPTANNKPVESLKDVVFGVEGNATNNQVKIAIHDILINAKSPFLFESLSLNSNNDIRVIDNSIELEIPFLDITDRVHKPLFPGDEMGLLGFAFDPNFQKNGFVYVNYNDKDNNYFFKYRK